MKFQPTAEKGATTIRLVDGSLNKFVDRVVAQELHIGTGLGPKATPSKAKESPSKIGGDTSDKLLTRRKLILLMRKVVSVSKQNKLSSIALDWKEIRALAPQEISDADLGELSGTALVMADYEHNTYKSKPKEGFQSVKVAAVVNISIAGKEGFWRGQLIAEEVNACRELCNIPGGDMVPKTLANAAKKAVAGTKTTVQVLGRREMEKLGMGAILGMARGSAEEPQFIVMEYWGAGKNKGSFISKPLVLVGKGVTFDTGGLNIKGGEHMYEMHMDMSGGAAVIHTLALASKLKLNVNLIGLVPAIENGPASGAVRPGDILTSLSGKTIEVLNTDAEGRVILADGVTYAKRYNPAAVVDVATLTGASLVALGTEASGFMTNEDDKIPMIMELAEKSGDYMWPFPAWEEYEEMVKGTFGDISNIPASGNSRYGGVIAGGMFIREFAKELNCLWVHIDMAPRMTAHAHEFLSKGAAGAPVRFLLALAESFQNTVVK